MFEALSLQNCSFEVLPCIVEKHMMGHHVRYLCADQSLEMGTPQFSLRAVTKKAI